MRQDIVDELADHLACAVRREMVAGSDEPSAWATSLEKFGDPHSVARRLWWQAMRSRIMSQRLSLVVQVCTLAACAMLVFVAWQMQEGQRTQQEAFLAALTKLTEPREAKPAAPPETRLAVQLKVGAPGQSLPEQAKMRIIGTHLSNNTVQDEKYFDPETGQIDFGRIPPGAYSLNVLTTFGSATQLIEVEDGESHVEEITLPQSGEQVPLTMAIERPALISPEDWDRAGLCFFASFERLPFDVGGVRWKSPQTNVQVVVDDKIARVFISPTLLSMLDKQQTQDPQFRTTLLEDMNRLSRLAFEQEHITKWPVVAPLGARYRLTRIGLITHPANFQSRPSTDDLKNPPFAVIWDNSHSDFPAWAKADGNVFVVGNEEGAPWNQQMFPWTFDIPEAMAREVLAQIQQNTELAAAKVDQEREMAEQKALAMAAEERASRGPTQNRVRVRFVEGTKEGPAVRPNQVALVLPGSAKPLTPAVDETGWADFGYLDAGLYSLEVQLSSGAAMSDTFVVHPQKDYEETIVCPPEPTPIVTRKILVPLSGALQDQGIEAGIEWEWQVSDAEKWDPWKFYRVAPFAKASDTEDARRRHWTSQMDLDETHDAAIVGEYYVRALQIRPRSIQLNWPRPNQPGVSVVLGRAQFTDQPWLDPATTSDEPITIGLPPDLLSKAEAMMKRLTPMPIEEAATPTSQ